MLNKRFPSVVEALASLGGDFVLDGELVAFDSQGMPSFHLLQSILLLELPIYLYALDLLNLNGELLVNLSIERRRELLVGVLGAPEDPLRLSPLLRAPSGQVLEAVRKLGLGKRINSICEKSAREKGLEVGRVANRGENGNAAGSPRNWYQVAFVEWTDARHLSIALSSPCAMTKSLRR